MCVLLEHQHDRLGPRRAQGERHLSILGEQSWGEGFLGEGSLGESSLGEGSLGEGSLGEGSPR